ncbi:chlorite dismutase [Deinococcus psychrotolerans]|uniref:Chlorite dismutase n=2 Tax=Deinococcus psychrotolerans TaxID=2489213 RepID=A0A3G8YLP0_9DEIO|nr:chlorite dismutase [Deinococcus psychrotolerans]
MSEERPNQAPETPPAAPSQSGGKPAGRPKMMVDLDPSGQVTQREPDRANRQFLNYAFYKLDPAFRRLPRDEQAEIKAEFLAAAAGWVTDAPQEKGIIQRTYSLMGVRADVDFMLWRIAFDVREFADAQARLNRTRLMGYLTQPYNYVSMQKRSQYVNRVEGSGHGLEVLPGQGQFLFIYPFIKTRPWYKLTPHSRQGMMDEHIYASAPFKGVRINTSYSYGIDDQEFVVSFDSDTPQEFVDLVHRLRYTEASSYTLRDVPMFTCIKKELGEILGELS